jgi:hypothetical protein
MNLTERIPIDRVNTIASKTLKQLRPFLQRYDKSEIVSGFNNIKEYCARLLKTNGELLQTYHYSNSLKIGRLFCSYSLQSIPREFRGYFANGFTTDIDMVNCHPKILLYLCKKHNIPCENLEYYCNNRNAVLEQFKSRDSGKLAINACINNDKYSCYGAKTFMKKLDDEVGWIQKSLTQNPEYSEIVNTVPDTKITNITGSALNRILCYFENKLLHIIINEITKRNIEIASLAFDGLLVYGDYYADDGILKQIETEIAKNYPNLNMSLSYKDHNTEIKFVDDDMLSVSSITTTNTTNATPDEDPILSDLDAANKILSLYPHWVCCDNELYVYSTDTGMWETGKPAQFRIFIKFNTELYLHRITPDGTIKKTSKSYGNDSVLMNKLPELIKSHVQNDNWLQNMQLSAADKKLFKNGFFDFKECVFHQKPAEGFNRPDLYFSYKYDFDFREYDENELIYMRSIANRIFIDPLGEKVGKYLLLLVSRAFAGEIMKKFLIGIGNGNNGKSVLSAAILTALGKKAAASFNGNNLLYSKSSNDEAQQNRWKMLIMLSCVAISNEIKMSNGSSLDANNMKTCSSGGDALTGRLHSGNETSFVLQALFIAMLNDLPPITPYDKALKDRLEIIEFKKCFVENPTNPNELKADKNIMNEIKTDIFQQCFIGLLIDTYIDYFDNKNNENKKHLFEKPIECSKARDDWAPQDANLIEIFNNEYEFTNKIEDYITSDTLQAFIDRSKLNISIKKFTNELKDYCQNKNYNNVYPDVKKVNGRSTRVWYGIKLIPYKFDKEDNNTKEHQQDQDEEQEQE